MWVLFWIYSHRRGWRALSLANYCLRGLSWVTGGLCLILAVTISKSQNKPKQKELAVSK